MVVHKKPVFHILQPAGKVSNQLTRSLVSRKDNFLASLLYDWPFIMGEKYAPHITLNKISFPKDKNTGATLHLSVASGSMALMTHHLQPMILEKVNQFVGYAAFQKINVQQIKCEKSPSRQAKESPLLPSDDQAKIETLLNQTPEGDLKEALKKLGESLYLTKRTPE